MSKRFSWTEPQLCSYNHDISRLWFVHFDFKDNETGKIIRKQYRYGINLIKTKEERILAANALQMFWKEKLLEGWNPFVADEDVPITRPLITEAMDFILSIKVSNCGKRTMESYRYIIKLFKEWIQNNHLQKTFAMHFTCSQARTYMDYLTLKKGYNGRTFNDHLTTLSTFFNCCMDRDWTDKNPFRKIKKLPVEIGRNIAFKTKERDDLRAHLYNHDRQLYYFTQFVYYCFIRRSELTRLRIHNIDFENWSIVIPSGASKNKKQESVVIPDAFVPVIKEMNLQQLPADWFIFGSKLKPGPIPYANYNHISTRHNNLSKALGIDSQRGLYSWKHTGVCDIYPLLKGDMYSLMRQLRHTELSTTQIYLKSLGLLDNTAIRSAFRFDIQKAS